MLREDREKDVYRALVEQTRGTWKQGDGLEYQQRMRAEWENNA